MNQKTARKEKKDEIISELWNSKFIDELIITLTSGHQLKDDLKSELFVILCEMDEAKIIRAHNNNYLNYLCVNILKKQYHSKTSPFHKNWRKGKETYSYELIDIIEEIDQKMLDEYEILEKIYWFVDNKLDLVDRELFKLYYKIGRYDRWTGDLRDMSCEKATSSLRKVERKLAITTVEGKKISIGYDTIRISLNRSIMRIKYFLKNGNNDITNDI